MNFSFDFTFYIIIKKQLLIVKTKNIIDIMQNIFNYVRNYAKIVQKRVTIQINKHRKTFEYVEKNYVFSINETSKSSNRRTNSMTKNLIYTKCCNV